MNETGSSTLDPAWNTQKITLITIKRKLYSNKTEEEEEERDRSFRPSSIFFQPEQELLKMGLLDIEKVGYSMIVDHGRFHG